MPERTEHSLISEIEQEWLERELLDFRDKMDRACARCESPIERVLFRALYLEKPEGVSFFGGPGPVDFKHLFCDADSYGSEWLAAIYAQSTLGEYRADFYIEAFEKDTGKLWFRAVIECDGHDFHERTKEQARRDKRRDRWFQTRGIHVIRFTGSEIWADPIKCAEEAWEVLWAAGRRHFFGRE